MIERRLSPIITLQVPVRPSRGISSDGEESGMDVDRIGSDLGFSEEMGNSVDFQSRNA